MYDISSKWVMDWKVKKMFGGLKNFRPVDGYDEGEEHRIFQYSKGFEYPSDVFADIICTEIALRECLQAEDHANTKYRALQKAASYENNTTDILKLEKELEKIKRVTDYTGRRLHYMESHLPQRPLKEIYDKIRQNPTWYLQPELIKDCIGINGCCSRGCGCCEKRHLNSARRNGIGTAL